MNEKDLLFAIGLKPKEAIAFLEQKGYTIGFNWFDVWQEAHTKAFTVAGVLKQDILIDIHQSLLEAKYNGIPQKEWEKQITKTLHRKGWIGDTPDLIADENGELLGKRLTPRRLHTIYQTNMRTAERVGEYKAMREIVHLRPYWRYVAKNDTLTRPAHAQLHNSVYHADDPFWHTFYPPNGWNCRCKVYAVKKRDVEREKDWVLRETKSEDFEEYTETVGGVERTLKAYRLPSGKLFKTDAAFNYNAGMSHLANLGQAMLEKSITAPPKLAAVAINETFKHPKLMQAMLDNFALNVIQVKANIERGLARPQGQVWHIGAILPPVVAALAKEEIELQSAVISISDRELYHLFRTNKANREYQGKSADKRLPETFIADLPKHLQNPKAVVKDLQQSTPTLLYIYDSPNGKVVIKLNYQLKVGKKEVIVTNVIASGEVVMDMKNIRNSKNYKLLWGHLF
ncbi:phage minor head protein [Mannheimia haemolytica]